MGKENDIIVNESVSESSEQKSRTVVHLSILKQGKSIDKKLNTIARNLVEKLLPFFITKDYVCPKIILSEDDGTGTILLNDFCSNELSAVIKEIPIGHNTFSLKRIRVEEEFEEEFLVRVFKLYSPEEPKKQDQPCCAQEGGFWFTNLGLYPRVQRGFLRKGRQWRGLSRTKLYH